MLFTSLGYAQFSGSGTEDDPYQIRTADDLFDIRTNLSAHYVLMNDIDLTEWISEESQNSGWNPIPNFSGVFNGNGYCIRGLYINKPNTDNVGLFSSINGTIKNLKMYLANITGKAKTGCLAGSVSGSLENIEIDNIKLQGESSNVGGITGYLYISLDHHIKDIKINNATIKGVGNMVGAFSGQIKGAFGGGTYSIIEDINCSNLEISASTYVGGITGECSECEIHRASITGVKIIGSNIIGGIGGKLHYAKNCTVINPIIEASNKIGGIVGEKILDFKNYSANGKNNLHSWNNYINDNCVIGGIISGNDCVGGIVGNDPHISNTSPNNYSHCEGNYASSTIFGHDMVGGICGCQEGTLWTVSASSSLYYPTILNNRSDCRIMGNQYVGGIIGYWNMSEYRFNGSNAQRSGFIYLNNNIVSSEIVGTSNVGGIVGGMFGSNIYSGSSISNNVCAAEMLLSVEDSPYRIFKGAQSENYAATSTHVVSHGETISVEDNNYNGISYGLRTLKRKNTYIGFGYDFNSTWAMVEGESFPYNISQSMPATIETCTSGIDATVSGTANGNGKIYVFVKDRMIEGVVTDGLWNVRLGEVSEGDTVKVSVETEGMKPSIMVSTEAVHVANSVIELDENSTEVPASASNVDVQVLRTIKADEWSTICLPFTATGEQVKQAWGEDVQLASFTGWESEEDGTGAIVAINVMFSSANPADGIPANTPMLIKVSKAAETATFDGVTIEPEEEPVVQVGRKASERGWFYGTYKKTIVPEENMFLNGNKFWYSTGKTAIKGYRGYFEFRDVLDAYYDDSEVKVYMLFDDDATGIKAIDHSSISAGAGGTPSTIRHYYNLAGQRISRNNKGIVIENGKKIIK